ncbi:MAG: CBS domain-containing protein [Proteobacteria bacterium]|nr:CBS domain-containing protein [Pseudomonadota bacterium]
MEKVKTVEDIMVKRVIYLREEDNLSIIAKGMDRYNLRHLPVVTDDKLIGLVSHRDLLRLAVSSQLANTPEGQSRQKRLNENTFVAEVMTRNPTVVSPELPIGQAARIMIDNKFGCLPVVDENEKLVGIITEHDLLKLLAS